ncbi:MAG: hypothetical protein JO357_00590, partial [Hyphomicrobiales bacterium]|nr:hypothetical protein [Hyphomicrobiales bacterium]
IAAEIGYERELIDALVAEGVLGIEDDVEHAPAPARTKATGDVRSLS